MKRHSGIILSILAIGISFGSVYGASTIISDSGINTSNLTVTGTCTGCGGGSSEGNYNSWNTVDLNQTLGLGFPDTYFTDMHISNDGNVIYSGSVLNIGFFKNGTVGFASFDYSTASSHQLDQSMTGKYQVVWDDLASTFTVLKDGGIKQVLGINMTQLTNPTSNNALGVAISPDGKYIVVVGNDAVGGGNDDRAIIFEGSP